MDQVEQVRARPFACGCGRVWVCGRRIHFAPTRAPVKRSNPGGWVLQVLVAERGPLVFVFNFSPAQDYDGYK